MAGWLLGWTAALCADGCFLGVMLLQAAEPSPPPPYPPPPPPESPAVREPDAATDAEQLGRKAGMKLAQESTAFQITPEKAVILWLVSAGVFLMLLPRIFRNKRARSGQRSD